MTQNISELQIVEHELFRAPQPLDMHLAEGVAVHGLFCNVQQRLVASRTHEAIHMIQNDEKPLKYRSHVLALAVGKISLDTEDMVDDSLRDAAFSKEGSGFGVGNRSTIEHGDIIWNGYDGNSARYLTMIKRASQTIMTDGSLPFVTIWELKAHPRSL